jgi:DNA-binding LacI/PurR family transcriptional regulator
MDTADYGPTSITLGFEAAAREHGYLVIAARLGRLDGDALVAAIDQLRRHRVEGIMLIAGLRNVPRDVKRLARTTPTVTVIDLDSAPLSAVAIDQAAGARMATRLLLDLGHRTITHLAGPQDSLLARQRLEAWHAELASARADAPNPLFGDWSAHAGFELGRRIAADDRVTAIFAANDMMALGVLRALNVAGRRVPDEVSLIGYDDIPEARYLTPPLTTVRQDFRTIGRESFELLLSRIDGDRSAPDKLSLAPELIVRESTSAAPDDRRSTPDSFRP